MKKISIISIAASFIMFNATAQKTLTEGALQYNLVISVDNNAPQKGSMLDGASNTIYLKGSNSRTEFLSGIGNETTIHDAKSGNTAILKEFSGQKLMIKLTKANWDTKNKLYNNINYTITSDTKTIAGYPCKKATATLENGSQFEVYYTTDINIANKAYDPTFSNLPGLAIQYAIETGKMKFTYTLNKVSFDAIADTKFDFPTSGYRVMTYEENQQLKTGK